MRRQRGGASCGGGAIGAQVLEADRADDVGQHPRRRPLEVELVGERLEQLVGIAGMHAVDVEVAGDVGAGQPEVAGRGGEVGGAARGLQVQAERRVVGSGRAAVVGGEPQRQLAAGEDLEDLGEGELPAPSSPASAVRVVGIAAP